MENKNPQEKVILHVSFSRLMQSFFWNNSPIQESSKTVYWFGTTKTKALESTRIHRGTQEQKDTLWSILDNAEKDGRVYWFPEFEEGNQESYNAAINVAITQVIGMCQKIASLGGLPEVPIEKLRNLVSMQDQEMLARNIFRFENFILESFSWNNIEWVSLW